MKEINCEEILRRKMDEHDAYIPDASEILDMVLSAMREAVKEACKEQREICADTWYRNATNSFVESKIANATEPNIK